MLFIGCNMTRCCTLNVTLIVTITGPVRGTVTIRAKVAGTFAVTGSCAEGSCFKVVLSHGAVGCFWALYQGK